MFNWMRTAKTKQATEQIEEMKKRNEAVVAALSKKQNDLYRIMDEALRREFKEQKL